MPWATFDAYFWQILGPPLPDDQILFGEMTEIFVSFHQHWGKGLEVRGDLSGCAVVLWCPLFSTLHPQHATVSGDRGLILSSKTQMFTAVKT